MSVLTSSQNNSRSCSIRLADCMDRRMERLDEESERAQEICTGPRVRDLAPSFRCCLRIDHTEETTATPWQCTEEKVCGGHISQPWKQSGSQTPRAERLSRHLPGITPLGHAIYCIWTLKKTSILCGCIAEELYNQKDMKI